MQQETKTCQNCQKKFTIESEDFNFYEKIKIPPPTFCPECRMQRRMAWRNVRNLYKSPCRAPKHHEVVFSIYSPEKPFVVFDQNFWWSDLWNPFNYGMAYNFSKPFFEQFRELLSRVPLPNINNVNYLNSEYTNMTIDSKNCYLVFSSTENEDCSYSDGINNCRNCLDLLSCRHCEYSYNCIDCRNSFNIAFAERAISCIDSTFLYDCRNCSNCFGCWNLRNKKYHIFNEPFSQKEYRKKNSII